MKRYIIISEKVTGHDSGTSQTIDQDSFKRLSPKSIASQQQCCDKKDEPVHVFYELMNKGNDKS